MLLEGVCASANFVSKMGALISTTSILVQCYSINVDIVINEVRRIVL